LDTKVVDGVCSAQLYGAISRFEDKWFPGQRSGFVDPNGNLLKLMEQTSAQAATKVTVVNYRPPGFLPELRASLLDDTPTRGEWTAGERVELDKLVNVAIKYIDGRIQAKIQDIGWDALLFGRAYITRFDPMPYWDGDSHTFFNTDSSNKDPGEKGFEQGEGTDPPPLPLPRDDGFPVRPNYWITTVRSPALVLLRQGECARVRSEGRRGRYDFGRWPYPPLRFAARVCLGTVPRRIVVNQDDTAGDQYVGYTHREGD
jgi:hypothetical protein